MTVGTQVLTLNQAVAKCCDAQKAWRAARNESDRLKSALRAAEKVEENARNAKDAAIAAFQKVIESTMDVQK